MRAAAVLLVLVACGGSKPAAAPDAVVGAVIAVVGQVTVTRPAQAAQPVAVGLEVRRDMTFTTGAGA